MNRFVNQYRGVTLIELMIVIVIVGIIAGLAGPQYGDFMKRQALLSESRRITSLLKVTRSEARSRSAQVVMRRAVGTDWSGTITVVEFNSVLGDENIREDKSSGRVLTATSSLSGDDIAFSPKGWVGQNFSIAICSSATNKKNGRLITVNRVGKIKEGPIGDASCT